jgi:hypothetical protein
VLAVQTLLRAIQKYMPILEDLRITLTLGTAPIRMLTFAEYNFIRAEAALRFNSPGVALDFFRAGISASMDDAGVAPADKDIYLAANGVLTGTAADQLKQIITEKYIASYVWLVNHGQTGEGQDIHRFQLFQMQFLITFPDRYFTHSRKLI